MTRWLYLREGVDRIMLNLREGMDMKTYMGLYTAIHNFCTAQKAASSGNFNLPTGHHRGGGKIARFDFLNPDSSKTYIFWIWIADAS
jgi:cullin 1